MLSFEKDLSADINLSVKRTLIMSQSFDFFKKEQIFQSPGVRLWFKQRRICRWAALFTTKKTNSFLAGAKSTIQSTTNNEFQWLATIPAITVRQL